MSNIDPVVTFGKYKDQGFRLSQLPQDYLNWMANGKKERPLHFGGRDWEQLAKEELERRAKGAPIPKGLATDADGETIEIDAEGERPEDRTKIKPTDEVKLSLSAIDDAAELLLREFIIRSDKSQKLTAWLIDLAHEAAKLGTQYDMPEKNLMYVYMKKAFLFDRATATLLRIEAWEK